jgi:hypothetical protein
MDETESREKITAGYRSIIDVKEDDEVIMSGMLKMIRVSDEVGEVQGMFISGNITSYEALLRLDILLGFMDEVRGEVKKRL